MKTPHRGQYLLVIGLLLLWEGVEAPLARADQAGGVPSLSDQVHTLQVQVQTLMTTISSLQTTVVNLQSSNDNFQAALNAEKAARIGGDNALQTAISKETTDRISGDQGIQALMAGEFFLVNNSISSLNVFTDFLQGQINKLNASNIGDVFVGEGGVSPRLNNNSPTTVASVTVPAGTYLIQAVVPVINNDLDTQTGECALNTSPSFTGLPSASDASVFDMKDDAQLPLFDAKTFAATTTITVSCTGFAWQAINPSVKALTIRSIK